jgi:hypothetical protein
MRRHRHPDLPTLCGLFFGLALFAPIGAHAEDLPIPPDASTTTDRAATPTDFDCLQDWAMVGHTRYKSLNGRLPEVLAVAAAPQGKTFPVGTLVMLQPSEAMLKRAPGSNPATDDWEYLKLALKRDQVEILERGGVEVKNIAGACNDCHTTPGADRICANAPGCKPLPNFVVKAALKAVATDPRCAAPRGQAAP